MRLLLAFLLLAHFAFAQKPFDYGKSKEKYYLSKAEIEKLGIEHIFLATLLHEPGGMHQNIEFVSINLSEPDKAVEEGYHVFSAEKLPPLDTLLERAEFVSGSFWRFENEVLQSAGMEGYGSLCAWEYGEEAGITKAEGFCKGSNTTEHKRIYYHPDKRVNYSVSWEENELANYGDDPTRMFQQIETAPDTVYYLYNKRGQITGTRLSGPKKVVLPVFAEVTKPYGFGGKEYRAWINHTPFEKFIDQKIGYRPKLLLLEIYPQAVFTFLYDPVRKQYFQRQTLELE